jgi:hypothetical protein
MSWSRQPDSQLHRFCSRMRRCASSQFDSVDGVPLDIFKAPREFLVLSRRQSHFVRGEAVPDPFDQCQPLVCAQTLDISFGNTMTSFSPTARTLATRRRRSE